MMKALMTFAVLGFLTLSASSAMAFEGDNINLEAEIAGMTPAAEPTLEQEELALQSAETDEARGIWHCTAYPEGGSHHHGHDAYDKHYHHAYYGALHSCQHFHHHCHVHCHYDF